MKKISIVYSILICLAAILFSCSDKKTEDETGAIHYSVHGSITNVPGGGYVYLEKITNKQWIAIDSAELKNNTVDFKGVIDTVDIYRIRFGGTSFLPIVLNSDTISFIADASDVFTTVVFSGSKDNETYADFNKKIIEFNKAHTNLSHMLDSLKKISTSSIFAANCMNQIKAGEAEMNTYIHTAIANNTSSPIVFSMLNYIDFEQDFPFIESVTTIIKQQQPNYKYTANLIKMVTQYKSYMEQKAAKEKSDPAATGKTAPEFVLPDTKGKMVRLSSFKGKYLLLDFWASWCGPCREESPNVVKAYAKFKGKNFDILSVSLDDSKDKWLHAIEKDGLTWNHVSDLKAWESSVVRLYHVEGIPATFLLDPNGVVVARDLRGDQLEQKLEELLK